MLIKNLFERDIFRPINGVVKADQLDESSVWQELDEFVVTRELDGHFRKFFASYTDALDRPLDPNVAGGIGVWVSGFFGSGKSHFLKVLSYLLENAPHAHDGEDRRAVEFFDGKIKDAMLLGDIKRAVASDTDVILFNIDSKADHRAGRDAILYVFLKVLNEMQGYSGDHPHIAHMERHLEAKGRLAAFHDAYRRHTGTEWADERDAYQFNRDEVVKALAETLGQSQQAVEKWIDGAEDNFSITVENFSRWVREYLDSRGPGRRIIFLVDEVGQFIGTDSHLMLNLQTITENLGTACKGRAWVVVTSQEDIDAVLGEMKTSKANDFSKIQGRFKTRLSLSSANVDEVIQARLLAKVPGAVGELEGLYKTQGDILKNQLTFKDCGMTFRPYRDGEDFVRNYPFAPYQFQLVQKIFEAIRKVGASGMHLARGERSMLDAFQTAAKAASIEEVGVLVPLHDFYPSIESFLDTAVKKTIDQAESNPGLEPFDIRLLQVLFLIRYVEEMRGNVDNLVTLCLERIDADRLGLRRRIEEGLARLEKETLISRNGDLYSFLTNEERDINKEIKLVELSGGAEAKLLGELVFDEVLRGQRKHRYSANKVDFDFNRRCDGHPIGNQKDGALLVSVITPMADDYEYYLDKGKCVLDSNAEGGIVLIRLGNEGSLGRDIRTYLQTERYLTQKNDGTQGDSTKRIFRGLADENQERRKRLAALLAEMVAEAEYFVAGQPHKVKATTPQAALDEAMEYLVQNTFGKMSHLERLTAEPLKEVQAVLRSNDTAKEAMLFQTGENNPQAIEDVRGHVALCAQASRQVVLHDLIEKRYSVRPYGWPDEEVLLLVARLLVLGEIGLMMDGALLPMDRAYEAITSPAKRRKITVIRRQTSDPKAVQNARNLGKELFAEMGPDGEDALFSFLRGRLKDWQANLNTYKTLAETGGYPGAEEIAEGLTLVNKLLTDMDSYKFIERFNTLRADLLDFADDYHNLEHFYVHQKPTWEKLRKAGEKFALNRLELERDAQAGPALRRIGEILAAPAPYEMIKDAEGLIGAVGAVNTALIADRRKQAVGRVDDHYATLTADLASIQADPGLKAACLKPLERLKGQVEREESLAHITQAEAEAVREFDDAVARIEEFARKAAEPGVDRGNGAVVVTPPTVKKLRVVRPAELVKSAYLETDDDVNGFLDSLRRELEAALGKDERIQIR
ncbi:BREX system P-loop protein BrxC [Tautonia plasticadhaerens]|uniref:BREX system P-loop protein BrxC n=1 Tax=Tautonia plasticadhaerens TaxID=2527974 RepID=A0A518HA17_9BACT|nr:BREX system P-loop protein BrxC [Tautonia plasticadhaerens]QDV37586.1 hypothetical protein ElP_55260 [Tautonia plasticadhaerens]